MTRFDGFRVAVLGAGGVLAAAVGVGDQALAGESAADRHLQNIDDSPAGHGGVHGPVDDPAAEKVFDHG